MRHKNADMIITTVNDMDLVLFANTDLALGTSIIKIEVEV